MLCFPRAPLVVSSCGRASPAAWLPPPFTPRAPVPVTYGSVTDNSQQQLKAAPTYYRPGSGCRSLGAAQRGPCSGSHKGWSGCVLTWRPDRGECTSKPPRGVVRAHFLVAGGLRASWRAPSVPGHAAPPEAIMAEPAEGQGDGRADRVSQKVIQVCSRHLPQSLSHSSTQTTGRGHKTAGTPGLGISGPP